MKLAIKNRFTGSVVFEADIECSTDASDGIKLGLAVKAAIKAGADLADANLAGADLADADQKKYDVPVIPNIDAAILEAVEKGGRLDMGQWHTCETTHCRAGWAVHLAGDAGYALEKQVGSQRAGAMIYRASRPGKRAPWFFAKDDDALADIRKCAADQLSE